MSEAEGVGIDREACTGCGECVEACPNDALELVGREFTSEELVREVSKDSAFYRRSGGGVTVGGGEPTLQHEFFLEFLERCRRQHLHTVMESCGFVIWRHLEKMLDCLDLVYLDIKHMDTVEHEALTGVPNESILENARGISSRLSLIVRIPVVPGHNDSDENILRTADFASALGKNLKRIELLPYHGLGVQTYAELGRKYELRDVLPPDPRHMGRLEEIIESRGVSAQIGG
jgi:pyruvate formate lyase activating enzyme